MVIGFLIWLVGVKVHLEIKHYATFLLSKILIHNRMLLTINTEPCYVLYYVFSIFIWIYCALGVKLTYQRKHLAPCCRWQ